MKAGVLGCGAIGGPVARAIQRGEVAGVQLSGVVHAGEVNPEDLPVCTLSQLVTESDLVIECAGQRALAELGPEVVKSGVDLLAVSTGALAEPELLRVLRDAGPGRLRLCSGAIGGIDLLSATARMAGLKAVRIATTKRSATLVQSWMDPDFARRIRASTAPLELARGSANEIVRAFPASANVAASVALAVGSWDMVQATVVADPGASRTSHVIEATGSAGEYRFEIRNDPSVDNPATSGVVPHAVLAAVARFAGQTGVFG